MNKASSGLMAMNNGRDNRYGNNFKSGMGSGVANASFDDSQFESDYDADVKVKSGVLQDGKGNSDNALYCQRIN